MKNPKAPSKNTGGGGFVFEDMVSAYYLSGLLGGATHLTDANNRVVQVDFQGGDSGITLDDLIIHIDNGHRFKIPFSIKSSRYITRNGIPDDFTKRSWKLILESDPKVFNPSTDRVGLITSILANDVRKALNEILRTAQATLASPENLIAKYDDAGSANKVAKAIFNSLLCPADLVKKHGLDENGKVALIRSLIHKQFDFEDSDPEDGIEIEQRLSSILKSSDLDEAENLHMKLRTISSDLRPLSGSLSLHELYALLSPSFKLKGRPQHESDWEILRSHSMRTLGLIRDSIGDNIVIQRDDLLNEVKTEVKSGKPLVILGRTGVGKTSILKRFALQELNEGNEILWFDASSDLNLKGGLEALETQLRLSNSIVELVDFHPNYGATIIIDGLDRSFSPDPVRMIGLLVNAFSLHDLNKGWQLIVSCQVDEWSRVQNDLLQHANLDLDWNQYQFKEVSIRDLTPIHQRYQKFHQLIQNERLLSILSNLRLLDMLTRSSGFDKRTASKWVSESDVAVWYVNTQIVNTDKGLNKLSVLDKLVLLQTTEMRSEIGVASFSSGEIGIIEILIKERHLNRDPYNRIKFDHEMFSDWIRLYTVLHKENNLVFLEKISQTPQWYRAIRLFGIHTLTSANSNYDWEGIIGKSENDTVTDLLLDSVLFTPKYDALLADHIAFLKVNQGKYLRRLINRFLIVCTIPSAAINFDKSLSSSDKIMLRATHRIPNGVYWLSMIEFLYAHRENVCEFAPVLISRIITTWLKWTALAEFNLYRREVTTIGLILAQEAYAAKDTYLSPFHYKRNELYRSALLGAESFPDKISEFALMVAKSIPSEPQNEQEIEQEDINPSPSHPIFDEVEEKLLDPWPGGPYAEVDSEFREVVLGNMGSDLLPLIKVNPGAARQVIYACIIRWRQEIPDHFRSPLKPIQGFQEPFPISGYPPTYFDGPFLLILTHDYEEGLKLVLDLVDFAADRWKELFIKRTGAEPIPIKAKIQNKVVEIHGDGNTYAWSAGEGIAPPHAIVSALMSLEKYFYMKIDKDDVQNEELASLLECTKSVSILAVLIDIGKYHQDFFTTALKDLLTIPELYNWDIRMVVSGRMASGIGLGLRGWLAKPTYEFHTMDHRKLLLRDDILATLFLTNESLQSFFSDLKQDWSSQASKCSNDAERDDIRRLITILDKKSYEFSEVEKGFVIKNVALSEIAKERQQDHEEINSNHAIFDILNKSAMNLEESIPLESTKLEDFWASLQEMASNFELNAEHPPKNQYQFAAICGGCALLIKLHYLWLSESNDRYKWCVSFIKKAVKIAPLWEKEAIAESISIHEWDSLISHAIPTLWQETNGEVSVRHLTSELIFSPHFKAVEILLLGFSKIRTKLGSDFQRILRLALQRAWIYRRSKWLNQEYHFSTRFSKVSRFYQGFRLVRWAKKHKRMFINAQSPPSFQPISSLGDSQYFKSLDGLFHHNLSSNVLEERLVMSIFSWLPLIEDSLDKVDRNSILALWEELLKMSFSWSTSHDSNLDVQRNQQPIPSDFDRWVFSGVAQMLPYMKADENPKKIWSMITALSLDSRYWWQDILNDFHRTALTSESIPPNYLGIIKGLADEIRERASKAANKNLFVFSEWFTYIFGINYAVRTYIREEHRQTLHELFPMIKIAAQNVIPGEDWIRDFSSWLSLSATSSLLVEGMILISDCSRRVNKFSQLLRDNRSVDPIALLLTKCWTEHSDELRSDESAKRAFNDLLNELASKQNPVLIELQSSVGDL